MFKAKPRLSSKTIETLEGRTFLSVTLPSVSTGYVEHSAIHADAKTPKATTQTKLTVAAGALGQAITFTVSVKTAAIFGAPTGTVALIERGNTIQTLTLNAGTSTNPKFDVSTATFTIGAGAGGQGDYIGRHQISATYTSSGSLLSSTGKAVEVIKSPKYVRQSDGLKIATVATGSGTAITAGQTATMMYTGYLAKGGTIFDNSSAHTPNTFSFTVEANPEQVISGFDQGVVGMLPGETRVLYIPYQLGYGTHGAGSSIPPKANLVFLVTLVSAM